MLGLWLAVAAGLPGLQVGLAWAQAGGHDCACPLDSGGHCACVQCSRLGVHDHDGRLDPSAPVLARSDCDGTGGALGPVPSLPMALAAGGQLDVPPAPRVCIPPDPEEPPPGSLDLASIDRPS